MVILMDPQLSLLVQVLPSTDSKALATWSKENAKVITWVLNSIDPSLIVALQAYTATSDMWAHLNKIHHQTNKARKFHLDSEIVKYSQGDKSVQEYFNGFSPYGPNGTLCSFKPSLLDLCLKLSNYKRKLTLASFL